MIPTLFSPGQSVRVLWRAVDVVSCMVRGSNGDGEPGSATSVWDMVESSLDGEVSSALFEETIYTLSCTDAFGNVHVRTAETQPVPILQEF